MLIIIPDEDIIRKKWQSFIPHEHRGENPKQIIRKLNITMCSKENTPWPSGIYSSKVYLPSSSAIDVLMWNDLQHIVEGGKVKEYL